MESDKIEQINKNDEMLEFENKDKNARKKYTRKIDEYYQYALKRVEVLKQQTERDHHIICEINNDNMILKQQNAELVEAYKDLLEEAKNLFLHYPNSFRYNDDPNKYFKNEIELIRKHTEDK